MLTTVTASTTGNTTMDTITSLPTPLRPILRQQQLILILLPPTKLPQQNTEENHSIKNPSQVCDNYLNDILLARIWWHTSPPIPNMKTIDTFVSRTK